MGADIGILIGPDWDRREDFLSDLPFTGERFTPECVREMWYEHYHRYAFARAAAVGKRVADVACGEGYGSAMLAQVASEVVGLDISGEAIAHARSRYSALETLRFEQGDASRLPWPDASFDLVTSFETLEHLHAQEELVAGFARILGADGVLLISSPDRKTYSDERGFQNEFHVRELYRDELVDLLERHFKVVRLYCQKLLFQSVIWQPESSRPVAVMHTSAADGSVVDEGRYAAVYYVAVCAQKESALPILPGLDLFGDAAESVYRHYEHEIRKNMAAGAVLQQADVDLQGARAQHQQAMLRVGELEARLRALEAAATAPPWWRRWRSPPPRA